MSVELSFSSFAVQVWCFVSLAALIPLVRLNARASGFFRVRKAEIPRAAGGHGGELSRSLYAATTRMEHSVSSITAKEIVGQSASTQSRSYRRAMYNSELSLYPLWDAALRSMFNACVSGSRLRKKGRRESEPSLEVSRRERLLPMVFNVNTLYEHPQQFLPKSFLLE